MTEGVSYLKYSKPSSYQTGNGEPSLYRANDQAEDELPNLIVFDDGNDYVECVDRQLKID
ncbi:2221_t:CDS:2 [Paraglomus occultum]|uniref:2221_t:CDS:1 n=1 Tax=Paraglomus occultum TaxID=144539 RepID=A0A9N8W461_9GLOM|nr:2221_t:CDS:2 [Paraglomus occultum]